MINEVVLEQFEDGVVTLTLNRPEKLNSMTDEMFRQLLEAIDRLSQDDKVGAVIITGAGRAFCAGADMEGLASKRDRTFQQRVADLRLKYRLQSAIRSSPKLFIAMLNGPAVGWGLLLALACDFRLAASTASLRAGFARIAASGDCGITGGLLRLIGVDGVRRMLILDESVSGAEACRMGLMTHAVEPDLLEAKTRELAHSLAAGPRLAFAGMKANLLAAEGATADALAGIEAANQARATLSADHREALAAFREKRAPQFTGR